MTSDRVRFDAERRDPDLLFRRHHDELFRFCRLRSASDADAEDVVSQIFVEALPQLERLRWRGRPVIALLYTIAGRRLADRSRRAGRSVATDPAALPEVAVVDEPLVPLLGTPLHGALLELSDDGRLAVYLRVVTERSVKETAGILGRTPKATERLLARALAQLRVALGAGGA